ncbi:MAG TPA: helix-turn-helix domain-containing protein [Daejeonella sp.]|uniref:helix-turn-helix domain-containing protein n=1 Tax=Daejeonella sp. TaxID=2805397 RepID=UPI002ED8895E
MPSQTIHTTYDQAEFQELIAQAVANALKDLMGALNINQSNEKNIFTRQETAEILNISLPTLRSYTKQGIIKSCTLGYKVRYRLEDIQEAIKNNQLTA